LHAEDLTNFVEDYLYMTLYSDKDCLVNVVITFGIKAKPNQTSKYPDPHERSYLGTLYFEKMIRLFLGGQYLEGTR
jgi:hypothetical protein